MRGTPFCLLHIPVRVASNPLFHGVFFTPPSDKKFPLSDEGPHPPSELIDSVSGSLRIPPPRLD